MKRCQYCLIYLFKKLITIIPVFIIGLKSFSQDSTTCSTKTLGVVHFTSNKAILTNAAKRFLDSAFTQINLHPTCRIKVQSYTLSANYSSQQQAWDRAYIVIWYLKKKGIDQKRFLFTYDEVGTQNVTNVQLTNEDGPFITVAPIVNLSTLKNISWKEVDKSLELQFKKQ